MKKLSNKTKMQRAVEMLKAVSHPARMAIVEMIIEHKVMNVTDIYSKMKIEQAVASQHLSVLKQKGVLICERSGKNSYYQLRQPLFAEMIKIVKKCQEC
jgi:ArsR family transcriptional regulator